MAVAAVALVAAAVAWLARRDDADAEAGMPAERPAADAIARVAPESATEPEPPAAPAAATTPDPDAPPSVTGRVGDASGTPLAGARVYEARGVADAGTARLEDSAELLLATTDGSGEFVFLPASFGTIDLTFRADGCLSLDRVPARPGGRLEIVLERGETVAARVLDALSGAPIPRARVRVAEIDRAREIESLVADDSGRFSFVAGASPPRLHVEADGYVAARFDAYALPPRGATLECRVVPQGTTNRAIFRVVDALSNEPLSSEVTIGGAPGEPIEPAKGLFRGPVDAGFRGFQASVAAAGHLARHVNGAAGKGRTAAQPIEARLIPAATLVGRAKGERGEPLAGARVAARQTASPETLDTNGMWSTDDAGTAGPDGRFALDALLPTATYDITLEDDAHAATTIEGVRVPAAEPLDLGDVRLEAGVALAGTVRSAATREPVTNATVILVAKHGRKEAITGADGAFRFENAGARAEPARLEVAAAGRVPAAIEDARAEGGEPLEILLDDGLAIAGRVVDEEGRPVAHALVRAEFAGIENDADREFLQRAYWVTPPTAFSDAEGAFRLEGLAAGSFQLTATLGSRTGRSENAMGMGPIAAGSDGVVLRIVPPRPRSGIEIVVLSASDERPIPQFEASVRAEPGGRIPGPTGFAGKNGAARTFFALEPGVRCEVTVGAEGFGRVTLEDVVVEPGEIRRETVALPEEALLEGIARTEEGRPVAGLTLAAEPVGGSVERFRRLEATTGPDGAFALAGLAAGEHRLEARLAVGAGGEDGGGGAVLPVAVRPDRFDARPGEVTTIALTMDAPRGTDVTFRVALPEDDKPRWLYLDLVPVASPGGARRRYSSRGARNAMLLFIPAVTPGEYDVDLMIQTETDPGNTTTSNVSPTPSLVVVEEGEPQTFALVVTSPTR